MRIKRIKVRETAATKRRWATWAAKNKREPRTETREQACARLICRNLS